MAIGSEHAHSFAESLADKIDGFFYRCLNDKDFTMVHLSSGFAPLLGYDADWFIASKQSFANLTHREDIAYVDKSVSAAIAAGQRWRILYRLKTKAGTWRPVLETGGAVLDPKTREVLYLDGVILDAHVHSSDQDTRDEAAREIAGATGEILKILKSLRLLALNARLESVRAGDHGLGFGIVAREMVDLAAQSDAHARVIEKLIAKMAERKGLAA
jgi:PAS domain-containing protein